MDRTDPFGWVGNTIDGQFTVEAVAGEGAFGIVYRGTHLGFEAPVAIKCLKIPADLGEEQRKGFLATFKTEARLLHKLSRRTTGIVQALDVGVATAPSGAWTPYTVMEWLEGETLEEDLRRRRTTGEAPRGIGTAIQLLKPAAVALAIAHEENVSHRDIKPANLFLATTRGGGLLKVLDFGIAKVFAETPTLTEALAQTGKSFHAFTPQYGAPEQFSPRYGATGPWTDVYAMALTLIEVASGKPALVGADVVQLFVASADEAKRPSLAAHGIDAPADVEAVLQRALAVSPAARYRDLGDLWAALEQASAPLDATMVALSQAAPFSTPAPSAPPKSAVESSMARSVPTPVRSPSRPLVSTGPPEGENRICTVMFVDLSGLTALSRHLAPEEVKDVVDRCFQAVTEHVEAMGGATDKPVGDRVMAVFGVPRASDNDAERAVRAALGIQAAALRMVLPRAARKARASVRIGIETGRVFAGTVGGTRQDFTVIGDAVNVASRLLGDAPPGAIVIGRDTYRQVVGKFDVQILAASDSPRDGHSVYRVAGPIASRHAVAPTDFYGVETRLAGRVAERQRLLDALDTIVSEPRARLVTLVGASGVGRSRLLAELAQNLAARSDVYLLISAQCSPLAVDQSYGLAAALVRRWFHVLETDAPEVVRQKLERGVRWFRARGARGSGGGDHGLIPPPPATLADTGAELDAGLDTGEVGDIVTQIASILGPAPGAEETRDSIVPNEAAGHAKYRVAAALGRLIGLVAARVPVVVLCDDVQWADDASLDLLDDVVGRIRDTPVLFVCAARPELYERRPLWGEGKDAHERVDVAPLPRRHVEEMIRDRLRRVPDLSADLVRVLADRAEGSPLTLVETLHLLVDAGVLARGDGPTWTVHAERLGALALPATVQGIVQARLDRLEPEPRGALSRAAVVGRTFWEGAVDRLGRGDLAGAPESPTPELLASLRNRQLVRAREAATIPGEREYVFAESATHEVAYETLSIKVRKPFHLLVAEWLEERAPGGVAASLLAMHFDRGGAPRRAAAEYARAAAHAASLGQNAEALRHFERARAIHDEAEGAELSDWVGEGDLAPDSVRVASWRDRARLRLDLGDVLRRVGRLDDAQSSYEEARARILRGERRTTGELDPKETLRWDARVDFRVALVEKVRGRTAEARALVLRAIERATDGGASDETPAMYALLAFLHRRDRDPAASWQAALRGLRVCRGVAARDERWREAVAELLFGIATAAYARGRMVAAERSYRQASRAVTEAESPHLVGVALNGIAAVRVALGDLAGAREIFLRSLRLKERAGDLHQLAIAYSNLADTELEMGEVAAALEHARRSVRLGEQVGAGYDLAAIYHNLAEASLAAGELDGALDAAEKALGVAELSGRFFLGDVAVTLARVIARAPAGPRRAQARQRLEASLATHFDEGDLVAKAAEARAILEDEGPDMVPSMLPGLPPPNERRKA